MFHIEIIAYPLNFSHTCQPSETEKRWVSNSHFIINFKAVGPAAKIGMQRTVSKIGSLPTESIGLASML